MSEPTVVVVSYRRAELLESCLASLSRHEPTWPVVVWDNRSDATPDVHALASRRRDITWRFSPDNVGFAAAVNAVAAGTEGDLLLLNPDAVVRSSLRPLAQLLDDRPLAAAAAPLVDDGDAPWDNARRLPTLASLVVEHAGYGSRLRRFRWSGRYASPPNTAGWASGACLLVRRAAWSAVGPFDERFWLYAEELDWCRRAGSAGWEVAVHPEVLVGHRAGGTVADDVRESSRAAEHLRRSTGLYVAKHHGRAVLTGFGLATAALDRVQRSKRPLEVPS
jgi:GT2 family glycosyltransferase